MMEVPFVSFSEMNRQIRPDALAAFEKFFDGGHYIMGERLETFEAQFAKFCGVKWCAGTSNGLDALTLALKATGIGPGDEVIIPSNTFIATALAVMYAGAVPVLAEPDERTYNITASTIVPRVTKKTRAIMPVHLYGQACEMKEIVAVAKEKGLVVIEDNAQAQGATYDGRSTGSWGDAAGTSFYPSKNLGAYGDSGAVTTNDEQIIAKVRVLRNYGSDKKYHHIEAGFNMRMDELQAALLLLKLGRLQEWNTERVRLAEEYSKGLQGIEQLVLPFTASAATHVYHLYVVRARDRDRLQAQLASKAIGTLIHYPIPLHRQGAFADCRFTGNFEFTDRLCSEILSLPLWPGMGLDQVAYVCDAIRQFYRQ